MARLTLLLAFLLPLQEPDRRDLIRQLGDLSPSVRDKASAMLEAQGDAALPELRRALLDADPEIRCRAGALVDLRTQEETFARLCREQRAAKLRLAELLLEYEYPPGQVVDIDGVRFTFARRPWAPDGEIRGTIFETDAARAPGVNLQWSVTSIRDGRELPIETCAWHSPRLVYVPNRVPEASQVRIRGVRRWACDVPMRFESPSDGQARRFAGYTVTIQWPEIVVCADRPLEESAMDKVLTDQDVRCKIRPGREDGLFVCFGIGGWGHSRCGGRVKELAWCGCVGWPAQEPREPESTSRETRARQPTVERYGLDAIESIELTLHLPIEETFEVTSPPLE
jgi:hypothetical protein